MSTMVVLQIRQVLRGGWDVRELDRLPPPDSVEEASGRGILYASLALGLKAHEVWGWPGVLGLALMALPLLLLVAFGVNGLAFALN